LPDSAGPGHRYASSGWLGHLFGRWAWGGLWWVRSGQPFSADAGFDRNRDGNTTDRAGLLRGSVADILNSGGDKTQYLKPRADVLNSILSQTAGGALGRNVFRGAASAEVHLSLLKEIPVTETKHFQFRFEAFNLLNRANFNNPIQSLGSPLFGLITSTRSTPRQLQFGLKFFF